MNFLIFTLMDTVYWKRVTGSYQIVTFDIGRGSRIRTHIDGFGDR